MFFKFENFDDDDYWDYVGFDSFIYFKKIINIFIKFLIIEKLILL